MTTKRPTPMPDGIECSWCGADHSERDDGRPFDNERGEHFCSKHHRNASNAAVRKLQQAGSANDPHDADDLREHHIIVAWNALAADEREWIGEPGQMLGLTISLEDGRWLALTTDALAEAGRDLDHERPIADVELALRMRHDAYATPDEAAIAAGWIQ